MSITGQCKLLCAFVLLGTCGSAACNPLDSQPDNLNAMLNRSRSAVAEMLKHLDGRCFAFAREKVRKTAQGIQYRDYSVGLAVYRNDEIYACYKTVRSKDEQQQSETEVEVLATAELKISSFTRDTVRHRIICSTSNGLGRKQEHASNQEFDVSAIFDTLFANFINSEFSMPRFDEYGRFHVSFSQSRSPHSAASDSGDVNFLLYFDSEHNLPARATATWTRPGTAPVLIADRRIAYDQGTPPLPTRLVSETFDRKANGTTTRLEFSLVETELLPSHVVPMKFAVVEDSYVTIDGMPTPSSLERLPEKVRRYLAKTGRVYFDSRRDERRALVNGVEAEPPSEVRISSLATTGTEEASAPSKSLQPILNTVVTAVLLLTALFWGVTWRRFQKKA